MPSEKCIFHDFRKIFRKQPKSNPIRAFSNRFVHEHRPEILKRFPTLTADDIRITWGPNDVELVNLEPVTTRLPEVRELNESNYVRIIAKHLNQECYYFKLYNALCNNFKGRPGRCIVRAFVVNSIDVMTYRLMNDIFKPIGKNKLETGRESPYYSNKLLVDMLDVAKIRKKMRKKDNDFLKNHSKSCRKDVYSLRGGLKRIKIDDPATLTNDFKDFFDQFGVYSILNEANDSNRDSFLAFFEFIATNFNQFYERRNTKNTLYKIIKKYG